MRRRLDVELVRRGLVSSRSRATAMIEEGVVLVSGAIADKPSRLVAASEPIVVREARRFASRGGTKLDAGLDHFGLDVAGLTCVDLGSSTGGFVDCLLQRGASAVVAVDVGRGLLDQRVREDPRVRVLEGVNARYLDAETVGGEADFLTADLSFISLTTVAPALARVVAPGADAVVLVKPQFEVGPDRVGRGGIVRDRRAHTDAVTAVVDGMERSGLGARGVVASSRRGAKGNVEFLLHVRRSSDSRLSVRDVAEAVEKAHAGEIR